MSKESIFTAFVSMPYGAPATDSRRYWNDFYNSIVDTRKLIKTRGYSINLTRASENIMNLQLKDNVTGLIKECDFVIAVITGSNPNVFWEVGFAECLSKPVVFLVTDADKNSPVLVNETLKLTYDGTIFDKLDNTSLSNQRIVDFQSNLLPFINTAVDVVKGRHERPIQFAIFSDRGSISLEKMIYEAEKSIDIITSNLNYFSNEDKFFYQDNNEKVFPFDKPISNGVKVRILSLNPDSSVAEYRAKQLGLAHDVSGYREELRNSARFFYQRYVVCKNVDIRIYDDLPLQITLMIDNKKIVTSIMSRGNRSRDNIHLYLDNDIKGAQSSFAGHFAEVLANQAQTSHISHFAWAHSHKVEDEKKMRNNR